MQLSVGLGVVVKQQHLPVERLLFQMCALIGTLSSIISMAIKAIETITVGSGRSVVF
jgi:hypothetical protein